jgi:hypothetical protein
MLETITPSPIAGERIAVTTQNEALIGFFDRFKDEMHYISQFGLPSGWEQLAKALNDQTVSTMVGSGSGHAIFLPQFKNRTHVVRYLLDHVIPKLLPALSRPADTAVQEEAPDWVLPFDVPGATELERELANLSARIEQLRDEQTGKEQKLLELLEYRGLLWLDGFPLERVVASALAVLGIDAHPQGQIDLVHEKEDGTKLYIEVEGTETLVQVRKGQQLLTYIAQAEDPASTSGAIIANPFRRQHPSDRPSTIDQLFSPPLRALAAQQKWSLITTGALFELVRAQLSGDPRACGEAQVALGL